MKGQVPSENRSGLFPHLHTSKPGARLDDFVELFWACEGYVPPHEIERRLPTGTTELVIALGQDRIQVHDPDDVDRFESFADPVVSGPHSRHFLVDRSVRRRWSASISSPAVPTRFSPYRRTSCVIYM